MAWLALLAALAVNLCPADARAGEAYPDPFEDARFVPSSVTQYFCFVEAGESLSELMSSSLAPGLKAFYETCRSGQSWRDLAASTGIESSKLFDMLVSRRVTLVTDEECQTRPNPQHTADFSHWVLMARVEEPFAKELLQTLAGRVREYVGDTALYGSGDLRFAYFDGRFYLAAGNGEALLRSMLSKSVASPLADDEEFREARRVGPGDFGMFKRGTGELHWQAGAAKVRHDRMHLNFVSSHEPHGAARESNETIDLGLLGVLAEGAIYVGVERTPDSSSRACERGGVALLPIVPLALAKPDLLDHLGPTMFTVVEPPEATAAGATGIPAMTVGIELRDPDEAVGELDTFMSKAASRLGRHRRNEIGAEPAPQVVNAGESPEMLRSAAWRGGALPMQKLGLAGEWPQRVVWSSVRSEGRVWWIASTDAQCQSRIAGKLQDFTSRCSRASSTQARGVVFGGRAASLIEQWPAVGAGADSPFLAELSAWRELLASVSAIGWRVSQPCPERTETYVSVSWPCDSHK